MIIMVFDNTDVCLPCNNVKKIVFIIIDNIKNIIHIYR